MSTYLFVLCPPYSGSTLLWKLLATSPQVSSLPSEGQFLPEVVDVMRTRPWDEAHELPWARIKRVWDGHWDRSKRFLVEKSPPNLIRTDAILAHFAPVAFVLMVRDPYAHCEGLMRRNGWGARQAAEFSAFCLRRQRENVARLGPFGVACTYEQLVSNPDAVCARLVAFLPDLSPLDPGAEFTIHSLDGDVTRGITDLNARKLERLTADDRATIGAVLAPHREVLAFWGYEIL